MHDVQGRRVAVLVDAIQEPGHYRVAWDGRADDGRILPSGHYFARLHVDDLAGHVLQKGGWVHLNLPAISEFESNIQTGSHHHYCRKLGEVLHPAREPKSVLDELKIFGELWILK